jgi:Anti-sigma factor NepR
MEFALSHPDGAGVPIRKPGKGPGSKDSEPGWAAGLRQLYNSVVDEPLPDSFDDLLRKLDQDGHDHG